MSRLPLTVRASVLELVDRSRPTGAGSATPWRPERPLATTVYQPAAAGAYPLIVFAHGLTGHPDKFTRLLSAWSSAGFVVAAPAFPLTNGEVPGAEDNWTDVSEQPAD